MKNVVMPALAGALISLMASGASAGTLDDVKKNTHVKCGVNTGLPGFAAQNDDDEWVGFDVDFCRAIAAAIFNDPAAVEFTPLNAENRFDALRDGTVDVLVRNTTWTMSREAELGLLFTMVNYYDGQGFMVRKDSGLESALELSGATVCVRTGTTSYPNLVDYFKTNKMELKEVTFEEVAKANEAYDAGACVANTTDASALYSSRLLMSEPDAHIVLPEVISKEPLGPVVRQGDDEWFNVVKWVGFALLDAEELGIKQANVGEMKQSEDVNVRRLVGSEGTFGESLGLTNDWAANAIAAVGNYGEIFERNVGRDSDLQIARGLNALWTRGGIQYAPPIQ